MKLTTEGIRNRAAWLLMGVKLPGFDIAAMRQRTAEAPEWAHFGAGNIFRGFINSIAQSLLNSGAMQTGIIAVESFDFDVIDKIYKPYDNLSLNALMGADGSLDTEVLAGIAEGVKASDYDRLFEIAEAPTLKLISFTITEKGYAVTDLSGGLSPLAAADIKNGPAAPKHAMAIAAAVLLRRYKKNGAPIAVVSMDNCSQNGCKLKNGITAVARGWIENGFADKDFLLYIESRVSFPWSMIDKITPRPNDGVRRKLEALDIEDMEPITTSKGTYIAPFVNAEIPQYLVIEDDFPNGRPPFEEAGVYLTSRETVNKAETMKVTTCLNPLHTGLAVFGCLLGYKTIWEEMKDADLKRLVEMIAAEGMRVVTDPGIIDPKSFVDEVINDRLPNPYMPDSPQRIATDTSQKIPVRYGETIKAYIKSAELDAGGLEAIPTVIAGWLRCLSAVDDEGNSFEPSADPMLDELRERLRGVKPGKPETAACARPLLENETLFGTDLIKAGLSDKIEKKLASMLEGRGAVRQALHDLGGASR